METSAKKENEKKLSLFDKLVGIQKELKAPKGQFNKFGKYKYRSAEDILEAVKPLLSKYNCVLTLNDDIYECQNRIYIKATVTLYGGEGQEITTTAFAREPDRKTGMDEPQVTGTASSYARKYALNGMFCIDDTKDPDTNEYHNQTNAQQGNHVQTAEPLSRKDNPKWQSFYNGVAQLLSKAKTKDEVERLYKEKYIDNPDYQKYNLDQDDIFQEIFNKRLSQLK